MTESTSEEQELVKTFAMHEAGHVVAAFAVHRKFKYALLRDHPEFPGFVELQPTGESFQKFRKVHGSDMFVLNTPPEKGPKKIRKEIIVLLAGRVGEAIGLRKILVGSGDSDLSEAVPLAEQACEMPRSRVPPNPDTRESPIDWGVEDLQCSPEAKEYLRQLYSETAAIIYQHYSPMWDVAQYLQERGRIGYAKARQIIKARMKEAGR